jgi:hypothetical protein
MVPGGLVLVRGERGGGGGTCGDGLAGRGNGREGDGSERGIWWTGHGCLLGLRGLRRG